jgi:hypothetical protein
VTRNSSSAEISGGSASTKCNVGGAIQDKNYSASLSATYSWLFLSQRIFRRSALFLSSLQPLSDVKVSSKTACRVAR